MSEFRRYRVASKLLELFNISSSPQHYLEKLGVLADKYEKGHISSPATLRDRSGKSELLLRQLALLNPQLSQSILSFCCSMNAEDDQIDVPHRKILESLRDRDIKAPQLQDIPLMKVDPQEPNTDFNPKPLRHDSAKISLTSYMLGHESSGQAPKVEDHTGSILKIKELDNAFEVQASRYSLPTQELLVIEDLLLLLLGLPGRYMYRDIADEHVFYMDQTISRSIAEATLPILQICFYSQVISVSCRQSWAHPVGRVHQAFASSALKLVKEFEQVVILLEKKFTLGSLGLQQLCFHIQPFQRPMFAVYEIVDSICRNNLRGGAIVLEVEKSLAAYSGDKTLRALLEPVLADVYQPVLKTAEKWLTEGELDDGLGEFFISYDGMPPSHCDSSEASQMFASFRVVPNLVPSALTGLSEKILLIGKYQKIIGKPLAPIKLSLTQDHRKLTTLVDERLALVNRKLLLAMNEGQKLLSSLSSCKQLYLVGNSDFLQTFLDSATGELEKPTNCLILDNLQAAWDHSISSIIRVNPEAKCFSIYMATRSLSHQLQLIDSNHESMDREAEFPLKSLDYFSIKSSHSFPATLVFDHDCMKKYELMFRFNFCLAAIHRELSSKGAKDRSNPASKKYLLLRRQLLHFVQNLRQYLAYEVLEPNWICFMEALKNSKGIDAIATGHSQFLDTCLRQATLTNVKLVKRLYTLFGHCRQFLALEDSSVALEAKLGAIQAAFNKSLRGFLEALQYFSSRDYDYHLGTLFSRMDYNSFYYANSYGDQTA